MLLQTHAQNLEQRWPTRLVQGHDVGTETLRQARQQVKGHDQEGLVGLLKLGWVAAVVLQVEKRLVRDPDTSLKNGLRVWPKACSESDDDGRHALEQRDQVVVLILQSRPSLDQRRHQNLDVLGLVERAANCVRECADGVVEDEQVLPLILAEGEDEVAQDRAEVRLQLLARFFFECGESAASRFLHSLVVVETSFEKPFQSLD